MAAVSAEPLAHRASTSATGASTSSDKSDEIENGKLKIENLI
jgi:hypothetical protein